MVFALGIDSLALLFAETVDWQGSPTQAFNEGGFSYLLRIQEQYLEEMTGLDQDSYLGSSVIEAVVEDFWLHLVFQIVVILPLSVLLTVFNIFTCLMSIVVITFGIVIMLFSTVSIFF